MTTTTIRVDADLLRRIQEQKPKYLSTAGFFQLLAEQALDNAITLGARPAGAGSFSSGLNKKEEERARAELINRNPDRPTKAKKDPFSSKRISSELVPPELQQHAALIVDFWSVKKGTRSERAWNALMGKLRYMTPEDQGKALTAAYEAGWASVYEPRPDTPAQGKWKQLEPEMKHPAYRDAREIIREQEAQWKDIPSTTGGEGVLEHLGF